MAMADINLSTISAQFSTLVGALAQQATSKTAGSTTFRTGLTGRVPQIITYVNKVTLRTITGLLKQVLKFFEANDVDWRALGLRAYHNSKFAELLRNDAEWYTWNTSGAMPNATGELKSYLGFDFIQLSEIDVLNATNGAADKVLIAAGQPICTGIWKEFNTTISVRHDLDDAYQVNSYMLLSSARLNEWQVCVLDISAL